MSENEKLLVSQMSGALANVDPVIAQALRPHIFKPHPDGNCADCAKPQTESNPKRFNIGNELTVQFKDGSMWIRQEQRYGEIEIPARVFMNMIYLAEKHGWICD